MGTYCNIPLRERNIVLIGFMGVGKTTIGQLVAKKLYRDFIDVDQEIEKRHQMSIPAIFEQMGEDYFRKVERELIVDLCTNTRLKILSLGGGAYLQEEVRNACLSHCIVFFLDLSWECWKERLPLIVDNRPVLKNKTLEEIEQLFFQRRNAYSIHNSRVLTNNLDPETVANEIVESIKWTWEVYEPNE
ncbi:shikimate kinase [Saccharococcus caldoxylosilyticus]|jgi:shikimate kinase|uniref:Shikimate kinase n=2 Tax=Saccharococcus caldoxylosilyticus TaxID=81408 RepID=A0A023DGB4_9BACL|nr:shikimate kinase [Parageobacillus caldoxylosilyticus]KYD10726.1 Shikimate kinase I [Parageobacillus caldoxylosilyticus]MBB3853064.1 shikimate kinase [Parageobacillus caldoxylosilyticus]QXJ39975.1 Shikimate kinase [Parageobacillus caldoxylosilyticus]BDG36414.1 shikimate kinase [Parageobacillus caldoxylosilyticus]BDG40201.1 shikimate kinase [Parageobacillus caldoxylosilyticus]